MQSANLSGPLKGLRPYQALIGPTQASGLAGGFDSFLQGGLDQNALQQAPVDGPEPLEGAEVGGPE